MPHSICDHIKWAKCNRDGKLDNLHPIKDGEEIERQEKCRFFDNIDDMPNCPNYSGHEFNYVHRGWKMVEYTVHIPEQDIPVRATTPESAMNKALKKAQGTASLDRTSR